MTLEDAAERRDGVLSVSRVRGAGLTRAQIKYRRATGRWRSIRRGVIAIGGAPRTWRQSLRAAVLAAGKGIVASHASSVCLFGLGEVPACHEVSGPVNREVRMKGVVGHRTGHLDERDVTMRWDIPCTSAVRTVIDMSGRLSVEELGRLVDEMVRRRLLTLPELRARAGELRSAPGRSMRKVRIVLDQRPEAYDPGESVLEARVMRLILQHGFPRPEPQHWVRRPEFKARLDHAYPAQRLYLEGDGFGWHFTASDLDGDARRRNRLVLDGWRPLTFTWRMTDAEIVATLDAVFDRTTGRWRPFAHEGRTIRPK